MKGNNVFFNKENRLQTIILLVLVGIIVIASTRAIAVYGGVTATATIYDPSKVLEKDLLTPIKLRAKDLCGPTYASLITLKYDLKTGTSNKVFVEISCLEKGSLFP